MHRITLTERHYDLVRRFMVVHKLPNARIATQHMIEVAATGHRDGRHQAQGANDEVDHRGHQDALLAQSHA